jgi:nucleotide-binding universal stress UspA family protein
MTARILVATDGRAGALGALRVARRLAEGGGPAVEVISVYEPMDLYAAGSASEVAAFPPHYIPAAVEAVRTRVEAQLQALGPQSAGWPLTVEAGRVGPMIARAAAARGSTLVLVGLRQPGGVERWLARETLLRLIHLSPATVLAVPEEMAEPPREAVVAVDFSEFSLHAAREAAQLLAPGGLLHLAHVTWPTSGLEGWSESVEWVRTYRGGVQQRMQELASELRVPGRFEVAVHMLEGDPAREILKLGGEVGADLIATGSHGAGFLGRLILGSVSNTLVHKARCAVLVAPPRSVAAELRAEEVRGEEARGESLTPHLPAASPD